MRGWECDYEEGFVVCGLWFLVQNFIVNFMEDEF